MDKDELKIYLKDNPNLIKSVLEEVGCTYVNVKRKIVTACRPDGDNKGAISIRLNDFLSTSVYTKPEFMKLEIKDIYTLLKFLCGYNLHESLIMVHKTCGLEFDGNYKPKQKSSGYAFLKQFKRSVSRNIEDNFKETILDENILKQFYRGECKLFSCDGIDKETQDKFQVGYDVVENRIIFPIRNCKGDLVSIKSRTCNSKYKEYGLSKYLYYYPYQGERYLYGLYENRIAIKDSKEILIFEAEKSVMQCDSIGINNVVAISKKSMSKHQVNKILKLGKDVILCFDKDVELFEIESTCRQFKGLCKVYYIWDNDDLLKGKESPSDKGKEVLEKLLKNKILYRE